MGTNFIKAAIDAAKKLPGQIVGGPVDISNLALGAVTGKGMAGFVPEPDFGSAKINRFFGMDPKSSGVAEDMVSTVLGFLSPSGAAKSTAIIVPAILTKSFKDMRVADRLVEGSQEAAAHFAKTGVYAAPTDDIIRQVISDERVRLKTGITSNVSRQKSLTGAGEKGPEVTYKTELNDPVPLSNILEHPALFSVMPDLHQVKVSGEFGGWRSASYSPSEDRIRMGSMPSEKEFLSTLLHEVQHAVQHRSGMATGGNPGMFFRDKATVQLALKRAEEMKKKAFEKLKIAADARGENIYRPSDVFKNSTEYRNLDTMEDAIDRLRELDSKAFKNYKAIGGEAEARAVEAMFNDRDFTAFPLYKYDVPLHELIHEPAKQTKVEDDAIVRAIIDTLIPPAAQAASKK